MSTSARYHMQTGPVSYALTSARCAMDDPTATHSMALPMMKPTAVSDARMGTFSHTHTHTCVGVRVFSDKSNGHVILNI